MIRSLRTVSRPRRYQRLPLAALLLALGPAWACDPPRSDAAGDGADVEAPNGRRASPRPGPPPHVLSLDPERPTTTGLDSALVAGALARADSLPRLRCLVIARHSEILVERCGGRYAPDRYANVKSVSKSVLSAVVGLAIEEGHLEGADERITPLLEVHLDGIPDARKQRITVGNLLSMQSGLERTSGGNYGAWVTSRNWVRNAIRRPMVAEPGGRMLYSTGNYHLLSAIITQRTGRSTLAYARERLGEPAGITIPSWPTDPQGIYFGGNDMQLTPRDMVRFGELYRNRGRADGRQVVPEEWVRASLEPRTVSPWSGERYGYGWFLSEAGDHPMFYAWGYGGQFIFVVPNLELTVVTTSDPSGPRGGGHIGAIHDLIDEWIVPAAENGAAPATPDRLAPSADVLEDTR